jgi:hypothetical protein
MTTPQLYLHSHFFHKPRSIASLSSRLIVLACFSLASSLSFSQAASADDYGNEFVDLNPDSFVYVNPELATWPGNQVTLLFNTNNLITSESVNSYINLATSKYERHTSMSFVNSGETSLNLLLGHDSSRLGTVMIEVMTNSQMDSYVSAITNGSETNGSSFGGYAWMWWNNSILSGQIALNADNLSSESCWKGVVTHEIGHMLNLAHSDTQDSIMFAAPYNSCEFQQTLRYDDLNALYSMYPKFEPNYEPTIMDNGCFYFPNLEFQGVNYQLRELCIFQVDGNAVTVNPTGQ